MDYEIKEGDVFYLIGINLFKSRIRAVEDNPDTDSYTIKVYLRLEEIVEFRDALNNYISLIGA